MKKTSLILTLTVISLLSSRAASAQVTFQQGNVVSTVQAQSFEYKLYQTVPAVPIPVVSTFFLVPTCTGVAPTVNCTSPMPATANKATGVKFELTARDVTGATVESPKSGPFLFPAVAPTSLTIQ